MGPRLLASDSMQQKASVWKCVWVSETFLYTTRVCVYAHSNSSCLFVSRASPSVCECVRDGPSEQLNQCVRWSLRADGPASMSPTLWHAESGDSALFKDWRSGLVLIMEACCAGRRPTFTLASPLCVCSHTVAPSFTLLYSILPSFSPPLIFFFTFTSSSPLLLLIHLYPSRVISRLFLSSSPPSLLSTCLSGIIVLQSLPLMFISIRSSSPSCCFSFLSFPMSCWLYSSPFLLFALLFSHSLSLSSSHSAFPFILSFSPLTVGPSSLWAHKKKRQTFISSDP